MRHLKHLINSETKTSGGDTPLMLACQANNVEMVDLLIKSGVDMEPQNEFGNTPLMFACQQNNVEIVNLLIQSEVNMEAKNTYGETGFIVACKLGHLEIVNLLIKSGANIESQNADGHTGFMIASDYGNCAMVELLIKSGVNMEAKNQYWQTGFMLACQNCNFEILDLLIKSGVNMEAKNRYGETGFISVVAHKNIQFEIVTLLLNSGMHIDTKNVKLQECVLEITENIFGFSKYNDELTYERFFFNSDNYFNNMCNTLVLLSEYDFYVPHRERKNQEYMYKENCQKLKEKFQIKIQKYEMMKHTIAELWTKNDIFVINTIFDFAHGHEKLQTELEMLKNNCLSIPKKF